MRLIDIQKALLEPGIVSPREVIFQALDCRRATELLGPGPIKEVVDDPGVDFQRLRQFHDVANIQNHVLFSQPHGLALNRERQFGRRHVGACGEDEPAGFCGPAAREEAIDSLRETRRSHFRITFGLPNDIAVVARVPDQDIDPALLLTRCPENLEMFGFSVDLR